jgi:hypothetical protein
MPQANGRAYLYTAAVLGTLLYLFVAFTPTRSGYEAFLQVAFGVFLFADFVLVLLVLWIPLCVGYLLCSVAGVRTPGWFCFASAAPIAFVALPMSQSVKFATVLGVVTYIAASIYCEIDRRVGQASEDETAS